MRLVANRSRLEVARRLVDMAAGSGDQVHSASKNSCQNRLCTPSVRQNAKCIQATLGVATNSISGSPWMQVMMERSFGQNQKLASASFANLQFWTERKRHDCMHLKSSHGSTLLDLRVCRVVYKQEKESWSKEQVKIWLQYKSSSWTRMKMRLIYSNFPKNITGFLYEGEL